MLKLALIVLTFTFFSFTTSYAAYDRKYINDIEDHDPHLEKNTKLDQQQQNHSYDSQQDYSKFQSLGQYNPFDYFSLGIYPLAIFGIDYDKNRYSIYLGQDRLADSKISASGCTYVGPFLVIEMGQLSGNMGITLAPIALFGGSFIGIGLGINRSTFFESSRIATTYEEIKKMPKIKKFPTTANEILNFPNGSTIVTKLSGGIVISLKGIFGFVATSGPEMVISGEWLVKVTKINNYRVRVALKTLKEKSYGFTASLFTANFKKTRSHDHSQAFIFEISLETEGGMKAYDAIFQGKISSLQRSAARKYQNTIKALHTNTSWKNSFYDLSNLEANTEKTLKITSLSFPILASRILNRGSQEHIRETLSFCNDQANTELGFVGQGTTMTSLRFNYQQGSLTKGIFSDHRLRSKMVQTRLDRIRVPTSGRYDATLYPLPAQRLFMNFHYIFQKKNWKAQDWSKEINLLADHIGFKEQLSKNLTIAPSLKSWDFAAITMNFKISQQALMALQMEAATSGEEVMSQKLSDASVKAIDDWFAHEEPKNIKRLCKFSPNCQKKFIRATHHSLKLALQHLLKSELASLREIQSEEAMKGLGKHLKKLVAFGKHIFSNQFTIYALLESLLAYRQDDPANDFALCIHWQGSSFRHTEYALFPSLRPDRHQCYLKEETDIVQIPARRAHSFFGHREGLL